MLLRNINNRHMGKTEKSLSDAFDRLKQGKPERLLKGALVSQNNVAKEAGYDPSAFRKSRFPTLIAEVQNWISENVQDKVPTKRQELLSFRKRINYLKVKVESMKIERDHALSLLVEADTTIVELMVENALLQAKFAPKNILGNHSAKK